jgi:hypothetical protein
MVLFVDVHIVARQWFSKHIPATMNNCWGGYVFYAVNIISNKLGN